MKSDEGGMFRILGHAIFLFQDQSFHIEFAYHKLYLNSLDRLQKSTA